MRTRTLQITCALSIILLLTLPLRAENTTTADQSTQPHLKSWSNIIPNANRRFIVLVDFNNEAVLDRETGLVWEKSPSSVQQTWALSRIGCAQKRTGGRKGWRLPSIEELASLGDPTAPASVLPLTSGHPFGNVQPSHYWSATTNAGDPTNAWIVGFITGHDDNVDVGAYDKTTSHHFWCVRGDGPLSEY